MENKDWLTIVLDGKSLDEEVNVYNKKAMHEVRQLFIFLLNNYISEIRQCNGYIKLYLSKDFKELKVDCQIICPLLKNKIYEIVLNTNI
jgi:hypothetical protein